LTLVFGNGRLIVIDLLEEICSYLVERKFNSNTRIAGLKNGIKICIANNDIEINSILFYLRFHKKSNFINRQTEYSDKTKSFKI
jgi:hypothetical protein